MNYLTDHVDFVQSMSSEDDVWSCYKIYKVHKIQKNYIQHFNLQKKGTQRLNRFKESIGLVKPCKRSVDPDETRLFSGFKCDFKCAFTAQYNQFTPLPSTSWISTTQLNKNRVMMTTSFKYLKTDYERW